MSAQSEIDTDLEMLQTEAENALNNRQIEDEEEEEEDIFTSKRQINLPTADEKPSRKRLTEILENPYPNKIRKNATQPDPVLKPEEITVSYRQIERYSRWLSFVWMTSNFYHSIIVDVYKKYNNGMALDPDGDLYITARKQIKDAVKGFKSKTLKRIIVSAFHFISLHLYHLFPFQMDFVCTCHVIWHIWFSLLWLCYNIFKLLFLLDILLMGWAF